MKKSVKNSITFVIVTLFSCISLQLMATEPDFSISTSVTSVNASGNAQIEVQVNNGVPGYKYVLYNKEPWEGGTELASSQQTFDTSFTFSDINKGNYYICVIDNTGKGACKSIKVE